MSKGTFQAQLKARPVPAKRPEPRTFNYELRNIVAMRYFPEHDLSTGMTSPVVMFPDKETFAWLDGLIAGAVAGVGDVSHFSIAAGELRSMLDDSPHGIYIWVDRPEETVEALSPSEEDAVVQRAEADRRAATRDRVLSEPPSRIELKDHQMFGSGN